MRTSLDKRQPDDDVICPSGSHCRWSDAFGTQASRERDPRKLIPPLHGALLKNEQDVHLFERLAFLSRREV